MEKRTMSIREVTPEQARKLLDSGAVLIDVRDSIDHARERIPQARNIPLASLGRSPLPTSGAAAMIFHCKSGARTAANAKRLAASAGCDTYLLQGGLEAWKRAGLPVQLDRKQPLELMRQVQIAAGLLVLTGVVLGASVSGIFYALAGVVGAGLTFAGVTGTCGMANLLRLMPWNRGV
jgi:rhodanese-related sulfurtransferase